MHACESMLTFGDHLLSGVNVHGQLRSRESKGEGERVRGTKEREREEVRRGKKRSAALQCKSNQIMIVSNGARQRQK
jgi:hypothetical protein